MKIDWSMSLVCQQNTTEPLKCPLNIEGTFGQVNTLQLFLNSFRALGMLPAELNFEEDMTVDELVENQGV